VSNGVPAPLRALANANSMTQQRLNAEFEQTVRAYSADLYRFGYWLCRDRFVAEELVQDTFERAWKNWAGLRDVRVVKSWLMTIVRNEYARRFARKRLDYVDGGFDEDDLPPVPSFEGHLELEQLVARLPQSYREPLVLQVLGGFDCREIAAMLSISEGAVMTRLTRARQALRNESASGTAVRRSVK
jgi:RNA polymerase sigma-70 factor, ECF subfamily